MPCERFQDSKQALKATKFENGTINWRAQADCMAALCSDNFQCMSLETPWLYWFVEWRSWITFWVSLSESYTMRGNGKGISITGTVVEEWQGVKTATFQWASLLTAVFISPLSLHLRRPQSRTATNISDQKGKQIGWPTCGAPGRIWIELST